MSAFSEINTDDFDISYNEVDVSFNGHHYDNRYYHGGQTGPLGPGETYDPEAELKKQRKGTQLVEIIVKLKKRDERFKEILWNLYRKYYTVTNMIEINTHRSPRRQEKEDPASQEEIKRLKEEYEQKTNKVRDMCKDLNIFQWSSLPLSLPDHLFNQQYVFSIYMPKCFPEWSEFCKMQAPEPYE